MNREKVCLCDWRQKELLSLPVREWSEETVYDSLLIMSTRKMHDSGWALISIIGVRDNEPLEQAANCVDDINWYFYINRNSNYIPSMRTDCLWPAGVMHIWGHGLSFKVGAALSSTDIHVVSQ